MASRFAALWVVVVLGVPGWTTGADADEARQPPGAPPQQHAERMVTIPGVPLWPMTEDAIRSSISFYEPLLVGVRVLGTKAALARGCAFLAMLHAAIGEQSKAEPLFEEALTLMERHGSRKLDIAWLHNNRGLGLLEQVRYAEALRSFRAALAAVTPESDDLREPRAKVLQNLGTAQQFVGDVEGSEESFLAALDTLRRMTRGGKQTSQTIRANLSVLYGSIGDHARGRQILEGLLNEDGLSRQVRFAALNDLGFALSVLKDHQGAETRLRQAETLAGRSRSGRLVVLQNLASSYYLAGDYKRSRSAGEEALGIAEELYGADSRSAAAAAATLGGNAFARGDLVKADVLLTRAAATLSREGGDREAFSLVIRSLALVAQRRAQKERALNLSRQALDLEKKNFERILAFGSEAQRLAYQNSNSPYDQLANLGDPVLLADAVLSTKGAVLESLLAERALARKSTTPAHRERLDRIHVLKVEIMEKIGRGETDLETLERALKQEETALAKGLAQPISEKRRPQLAHVQARLADDQVLIEIVRFQSIEANGKAVWSYGGIVIPHEGMPRWVPLGRADIIEESIEPVLALFSARSRGVRVTSDHGPATRGLRNLEERLWKPLEQTFPLGVRKVLLSPDGATHFIPWAALLDENGTFLAERWQIAHVGSGRDLLRGESSSRGRTVLALADGRNDLIHSRVEVEDLASRAQANGWAVTVLPGEQATEMELVRQACPRILHLATHGGELSSDVAQAIESRLSRNPMYRSYLLLGGARKAFEAWDRNEPLPFFDDGILTAEEVGGLNLDGNWLAILSACRTGRGDARLGEGVLGLRRGFALAGTENLMFTLWDVNDAATARFMSEFYRRLFETSDLARSFHATQVAELRRWKQAQGARTAVERAGAFVLTVTSAPPRTDAQIETRSR